jgi:hypothetical protein
MQKNIIELHNTNAEEFKKILLSEFKVMLENAYPGINKKEELLTRKETAELLSISLPTLRNYVKRGLVNEKRIGSRVLYIKSEILDSLVYTKNQ